MSPPAEAEENEDSLDVGPSMEDSLGVSSEMLRHSSEALPRLRAASVGEHYSVHHMHQMYQAVPLLNIE